MNWNLQRVAIVLLLTIGVVGCSRSPHSRRDKYLSKGNEYLQKQDFQRAALEFRNAISAMPNDAEGYYRLGMASAGTGDLKTAVLSYRKALAIDPKHAGAQLKLSELMVMAADKKWSEEAQPILKGLVSGPVVTPEALNTLAVAEIKLGNVHEAQRALERALETSPQELSSSAMLARLKLANNDVAAAEQVLSKAVQAAPNSPDAHVLLSQFYATQKRYQDAEGELNSALKIDPKHGAALMTLGRLQNTLGRKDEAAKTFERLSTTGPAAFQQTYALFLYSEGRRDESVREFERIVKKNPDDRAARSQLVASYVSVNRVDDAEKTLAAALKKNEKDIDALLQRAELMLSAGKYTQAEADLNTLLHFHPDSAFAHFAMGRLRVANGSTSQARQEYAKALELDPFLAEARLELAKNLTAAKDPKGAIDVIDQAPDPIRALTPLVVERNWALWALGDMSAMRKGIDDGLARERSSDLLIQDAVWKLRNRNAAAARTAIDEALKADLTNPRTAIALRAVYGSQKQLGEAVKKMREAVALQPKSAIAQNALGDVLLSANDRAGAREAFETAKRVDATFTQADMSLARLDILEGKWDDAAARLKGVLSRDARNTTARLWLGEVESVRGHLEEAVGHFQAVVEVAPRNTDALNNLAYLLADYRNQPDMALKYAQTAQELAPDNPEYADTVGWALYKKGLYGMAVKQLERSASLGESALSQYHLAMAYAMAGDAKRARTTLDGALAKYPGAPEAKAANEVIAQGGRRSAAK